MFQLFRKTRAASSDVVALEFPVLLDLLAIYMSAGQAFQTSLARSERVLEKRYPTLAHEVSVLSRILFDVQDVSKALDVFALRSNAAVVHAFATIVAQSGGAGVSMPSALRALAAEARASTASGVQLHHSGCLV